MRLPWGYKSRNKWQESNARGRKTVVIYAFLSVVAYFRVRCFVLPTFYPIFALMHTITITNLSIGYGRKAVWQGLSGMLHSGELTCLLGTNGVGKSTLLRTIAGLQPALAGEVLLCGADGEPHAVDSLSKGEMSRLVSVVLTEHPDVHHFSVEQMVAMGRLPYTGFFGSLHDADREVVALSLRAVGLEGMARREFDALSDGERQKVMIAKALAQQTPVILLDEPTAFLDYPSKVETMKMLRQLAAETDRIVVLSTHDLGLAHTYADRLLTLDNGLSEMSKDALESYLRALR